MLDNTSATAPSSSSDAFGSSENGVLPNRRSRRPAGTPDPDAEVVSLSPKTLLESDRYVCEICNQGFQRDQNLQMHRRRHKVPWKLVKRESAAEVAKKRVFVCPEPSCLHHDPRHALGDLVGIKKHFRRKHSNNKQWVCDKCSKGYAVQSDYKAHLKTCGTRGHSCDCGRVFSRVESFIEHQDTCTFRRVRPELQQAFRPACSSQTASSTSTPSSDTNFSIAPLPGQATTTAEPLFSRPEGRLIINCSADHQRRNLELHLLPSPSPNYAYNVPPAGNDDENSETNLKLSIGSSSSGQREMNHQPNCCNSSEASRLKEIELAMAQKAHAEEARLQAKKQIELAELEFSNAKRIRQQAQGELEKAQLLKRQATKKISSTILEITCHSCKQQFRPRTTTRTTNSAAPGGGDETSVAASYMYSALTEGE